MSKAERGMSLREAVTLARELGLDFEVKPNGEMRFGPRRGRHVVVHGQRKDASCRLVSYLRQIERVGLGEEGLKEGS